MAFHRKDQIGHPSYGTGEVRKVAGTGDFAVLTVYFAKSGTERQLNAAWVAKNCTHIPHRTRKPDPKPVFQPGDYREDPALSTPGRQVFVSQSAPWTDRHRQGLARLLTAAPPELHFAMIGIGALVLLEPEEGTTPAALERAAWGHVEKTLATHPDFGCLELADGGFVLTMNRDRLWLPVPPELANRTPEGKIPLETLLTARAVLLEDCHAKQIYAIVKSVL